MGRKRLKYKKKPISVSIDERDLEALDEAGINKSRLFQIAARKYLKKKKKYEKEKEKEGKN